MTEIDALIRDGVARVNADIGRDMPLNSAALQAWMEDLAGSRDPADYFLHPNAFPTMLLPWWVEHRLTGKDDPTLQKDLIYSNAILYYYTRMVDNVMDGHATVETKLLPSTGYFVVRGHDAYRPWFPSKHPFWDFFAQTWSEFADVTTADGQIGESDERTFITISSRKVCAAKISVGAVCFLYGKPELIEQWSAWIDLFGRWHLFQEDMFDWQQDFNLGIHTFFLSEAARRKNPGELEVSWIAREGMDWGFGRLNTWIRELRQIDLASEAVMSYLDMREKRLSLQREKISKALDLIRQLSNI